MISRTMIGAWTAVMMVLTAGTATAWWRPEAGEADPHLPFLSVHHADSAPVVDGRLDDPAWAQAETSSVFRDEYGFPVASDVTFRAVQHDRTLYIGVRVRYDPDNRPQAKPVNHGQRDADLYWMGENITLSIAADRDRTPGYYRFTVTPGGVTGDWFIKRRRDYDARWAPRYEVAVHWTHEEWTAEWGIPIAAFDRTEVLENVGCNIIYLGHGGVMASWSPLRSDGWHFPHRFGEVRGLRGEHVIANEPGRFHRPFIGVSEQVIRAAAEPSLIPEQPPELLGQPVTDAGRHGVDIALELNTATDVAVWIEDDAGRTVRHLAAGMLGDNPPPPLRPGTLRQNLRWDYLDDRGERVPPGAYRVRVGAGLRAELDRVVRRRTAPRDLCGIAVDGDGSLVVVGGRAGFESALEVQRHGRDGTFQTMLHPPRADIPVERLRGLNVIDYGDDGRVTFGSHRATALLPSLDTPMPQDPLIRSDGQVILFGGEFGGGPARFYKLNADGSLPEDFIGPYVMDIHWQHYFLGWATRFHFALDPRDEDVIYLSGLKTMHRSETGDERHFLGGEGQVRRETWYNAVYRVRWGVDGALEHFAGTPNVTGRNGGDGPGDFDDPQGLAFDPDGNLWVCDRRNNRIQVLDRNGRFLRSFNVPRPYQVDIHPVTGEAYVLASEEPGDAPNTAVLIKFSNDPQPRELYRSGALGNESYWRAMTLDAEDNALWVTGGDSNTSRVYRIADRGNAFTAPEPLIGAEPPDGDWGYQRIAAGWDSDVVWANGLWIDGDTGAVIGRGGNEEMAAARDGTWMVRSGFFGEHVTFYPDDWPTRPDAAPLRSWPVVPPSLNRAGRIGSTVAPNGDVYIARFYQWQQQASGRHPRHETNATHIAVDRYNRYGEMLEQRLIRELSIGAASPVVDIHGRIHIVDNIGRRIGQFYEDDIAAHRPSWMQDNLRYRPDWDRIRRGEMDRVGYEKFVQDPLIRTVGTVYRFGPGGGGLLYRAGQGPEPVDWPRNISAGLRGRNLDWGYPAAPAPDRPATHWSSAWIPVNRWGMFPRWQEGVEWEFLGASPATGRYNLGHSSCICPSLRIAVDDFSRVYVPASHRSAVRVVDGAGNEILRIGRYANMDACAPGRTPPEPAVPLYQPHAVALSRRYLYIGETRFARLLRIRLGYHAEQAATVTAP